MDPYISACPMYHFSSQACLRGRQTFREVTDLLLISSALSCHKSSDFYVLARHLYIDLILKRGS
jgi:hypothetical protein